MRSRPLQRGSGAWEADAAVVFVARSSADERLLAEALDALKQAALQLGDRSGIEAIADELDAIHRWNDELWLLQFVLLERGYVAVGTARWEEADLRLQEALEISRRIGDRANELLHLSMIAWRDRCLGRHAKALPILENVARRAHEMGHGEWSAWTSLFLGSTLLDLDPEVAAPHFVDAMRSAEEAGAVLHLVRAVGQLAWCSWLLEDRDGAADLAARATSIFADVVCPEGTANLPGADAYLATGRVLVGSGDAERAAALVSPVAEAGRRFGWVEASAGGAIVLGRCSESMGETDMALAQFREAIDIAGGAGMPVLERDARAALSGALAAVDPDEAARQSSRADQITARLRAGIEDARLGAGATLSAPHGSTVE